MLNDCMEKESKQINHVKKFIIQIIPYALTLFAFSSLPRSNYLSGVVAWSPSQWSVRLFCTFWVTAKHWPGR